VSLREFELLLKLRPDFASRYLSLTDICLFTPFSDIVSTEEEGESEPTDELDEEDSLRFEASGESLGVDPYEPTEEVSEKSTESDRRFICDRWSA